MNEEIFLVTQVVCFQSSGFHSTHHLHAQAIDKHIVKTYRDVYIHTTDVETIHSGAADW